MSTMSTPSAPTPPHEFAANAAALEALERLTSDVRQELASIRRQMARDSAAADDPQWKRVLEANEHLVDATLTAERRAEEAAAELEQVERACQFDALTGMPNRSVMRGRLDGALAMARRHGTSLALLFLDLDHFKQLNDTAGHAAGDEVLKRVADRLRKALRESDTVSREGGDEFLVLLPDVGNAEGVAGIAQKLLEAVAKPMVRDGCSFKVCASIGVALWPGDGGDGAALIDRADAAMYEAKRAGGGTYRFAGAIPGATGGKGWPALSSLEGQLRTLRDVNEMLVTASLRAQDLLDAAEVLRETHAQVMAVVAHEIRNRLAPIRTVGNWLYAGHPDDAQFRKASEVIGRQVAQMSRLVDDLLDSSRISTAGFRLERVQTVLRDVLQRSIEACEGAMLARQQTLTTKLPPPSVVLDADPMRLEQVFGNLLNNASKYTPPGGHIDLSVDDGEEWVVVSVSDDGIGVAPDALPHIFDLFMQEQRALGQDAGGMGIGLAIVRGLVQAHGGTVEARSAGPGRGSTFVVRLPRKVLNKDAALH